MLNPKVAYCSAQTQRLLTGASPAVIIRQGAKLRQRDKLEHEQPDVVHHARQRRVLGYWDARQAPWPFVNRLPVQPDPRSNRQQVLDPRTLPGGEPVRVAVQLHAPKVRLELDLRC